ISDIAGVYGVSFLVMLVNAAIVEIIWSIRSSAWPRMRAIIILISLFLLPVLGYGYFKLIPPSLPAGEAGTIYNSSSIRISVIQGNIPQELKWNEKAWDFIIDKYFRLTKEASKDKPDLLVWPEASLPVVLEDEPEYFSRVNSLAEETGIPLLLGAVTTSGSFYYNSAILVYPGKEHFTQYNKLHLVPFGEFIPLRGTLPFLQTIVPIGDIAPGRNYTVFTLKPTYYLLPTKFSVLICFEDLFPELSREFVKRGANFLVNITNDAWYKKTSALEQHFQASVFRAVENRVYLVRSANTGISGFIDPFGRTICLDRFRDAYYVKEINPGTGKISLYTRFGDVFVLLCGIIALIGTATIFLKARTWKKNSRCP
ncbi:MAG: apolipoprotein N-acyltransferase, partial [Candidatus Omnitrophica bacterium]|nr:apolipoprotein N-acyltransferase [Candidatus Omnitrophota bacterium]